MRTLFLVIILFANINFSIASDIKEITIGTDGFAFPYSFNMNDEEMSDSKKCTGSSNQNGFCGFEIDLFNAICDIMKIKCNWHISQKGPLKPAEIEKLDNIWGDLLKEDHEVDVIVATKNASKSRRKYVNFGATYAEFNKFLLGPKTLQLDFSQLRIVPDDILKNQVNSHKLRIGTWGGNLIKKLMQAYSCDPEFNQNIEISLRKCNLKLKHIEIIMTGSNHPLNELVADNLDLAYVFTGVDKKAEKDFVNTYLIHGPQHTPTQDYSYDPYEGTSAGVKPGVRGLQVIEILNEGLAKIRKDGTYLKISEKWLGKGRDLWSCIWGPHLVGDPKCNQK